jgi:formate C-acetyltransferase
LFFERESAQGTLSREQARELLQAFWVKFNNHPAPPKVGVTAQESNTYTDFSLINVGGVKADGSDAVNELTYLILDVIEEMRLLQPSSMVQISKKNPDRLVKRAIKIIKTGFGQPSLFNTDAIVQELVRQGKSLEDARCGGASGCVESGAFGKEAYILTGYFNLPKVVELTLHNGVDRARVSGSDWKRGRRKFREFRRVLQAFEKQVPISSTSRFAAKISLTRSTRATSRRRSSRLWWTIAWAGVDYNQVGRGTTRATSRGLGWEVSPMS